MFEGLRASPFEAWLRRSPLHFDSRLICLAFDASLFEKFEASRFPTELHYVPDALRFKKFERLML